MRAPAETAGWARPGAVCAFLVLVSSIRLVYVACGSLDLSPDEAHYWEWSRHLDLSYYSKGPLIAYLIALQTVVLGHSVVAVRFGAVAASFLGGWVIYRLGVDAFGDRRPAALAVMGLQLTPMFWAGSLLMTIDPPFLLLWAVALLCLHRAITRGSEQAWLLAGLVVGLGFLAKYAMVFVLPGLLLYGWRAKMGWRWLRRPAPWAAIGIALATISPVIVWNLRRGLVSAHHVASQGRGKGVTWVYVVEFLASQVGVLTPVVAGLLAWGLWIGIREGLGRGREPYRFLIAFAVPVVVFYLGLAVQGKVQANWVAVAYPSLALATAGALVDRRDRLGPIGGRAQTRVVAVAGVVAVAVIVAGHWTGELGLPARFDPTTRLRGWRELGATVQAARDGMPDPGRTFLASDRYQVTSELAFYVAGHPPAYNLNLGRRLNQYDLWETPNSKAGWDAIYVEEGIRPLDARVTAAFERIDEPLVAAVRQGDRLVRRFAVYRAYGFRGAPVPDGPPKY